LKKIPPSLAVIFAALLWSIDGFLRQELNTVPSILIVSLEHSIGAIIFLPFLVKSWKSIKTLGQREWVSILWIAIFGGILGTFFYTKALGYVNYINLSVVVLLQKLQPVFAIALSSIILKEKLSNKFISLSLSAIIGAYLVTFGSTLEFEWNDKTIIASLLALLSAFCWGSSTVLGKHALKSLPFETVTSLRLTVTAFFALIALFATAEFSMVLELKSVQWQKILMIVFSSGSIALAIYYYGLQNLPASHTTIYELAWPLSALLLDWAVRDQLLNATQLLGALILLVSMIVLSKEN
jgi:Predicted membrane protein